MGALPTGVLQYAAFVEAVPGDAVEAAELADWLFDRGQFPRLDGVDTELLGIEVCVAACSPCHKNQSVPCSSLTQAPLPETTDIPAVSTPSELACSTLEF